MVHIAAIHAGKALAALKEMERNIRVFRGAIEDLLLSLSTILLVVLILLLLGALPTWPYSAGWGSPL